MASPLIFAHRGACRVAPENTLPAFEAAMRMGAHGVELDAQCTQDGHLVVIHDFSVDKTTSGSGAVKDFTLAELQGLDAGSHFAPEFAGTSIPTLSQVLDLLGDRCRINIEVKTMDRAGGDEVEPLVALIRERKLYEQVIVSSFNPIALIKMRWMEPQIELGLLHFEPLPDYLRNAWLSPIIAPEALHPHHTLVDADYVAWAQSQGCAINTWTVNEPDEARRLASLGVNAIITDVPDQLLGIFE